MFFHWIVAAKPNTILTTEKGLRPHVWGMFFHLIIQQKINGDKNLYKFSSLYLGNVLSHETNVHVRYVVVIQVFVPMFRECSFTWVLRILKILIVGTRFRPYV